MIESDDLNNLQARAILRELEKRRRQQKLIRQPILPSKSELMACERMRGTMFPQQKAFFDDPARRKVGFCTRRAGKSYGIAIDLLASLVAQPDTLFLYMAQTKELVKMYVWAEMKRLTIEYGLPLEFSENHLWIAHKRGMGKIICRGADNEKEVNKLRGPKWGKVYLDESSTFGSWMEALAVEVIGPALRDRNGTLALLGTAGRRKEGLFYEACMGLKKRSNGEPVYKVHKWSLQDNPFLSEDAKDLDLIMDEEGMTDKDPRFLREYKMTWAAGDSERVWSGFDAKRNCVDVSGGIRALPEGHVWQFLLGIDFGYTDESAVAVIGYSTTHTRIYIMETWAKRYAHTDEIFAAILKFKTTYGAKRLIGDVNGQGKIHQATILRDYKTFLEPAKKMEKLQYIEYMNSAFLRSALMVQANDPVIDQFNTVAWDADRKHIGAHEKDDRAMAAMYGWRTAANMAGKSALKNANVESKLDKGTIQKLQACADKPPMLQIPWWQKSSYDTLTSRPIQPFAPRGRT